MIPNLTIQSHDTLEHEEVITLYQVNGWSAAEKPDQLLLALKNSDTLVTARVDGRLVGLGTAISDGHLVVYYPHLLVHPEYQSMGVGRQIMKTMLSIYQGFHQQMLTADGEAIAFYESLGFERAGNTASMWIYDGDDH